MLTGLLATTGGVMRILGEDMSDIAKGLEVKRRIGVVPRWSAVDGLSSSQC